MHRQLRVLLFALAIPLISPAARAGTGAGPLTPLLVREIFATTDIPDPSQCTVLPADNLNGAVVAPLLPHAVGASVLEITVRNNNGNPYANAAVSVQLTSSNPICPGAVLLGYTDASGHVSITVGASGCASVQQHALVIRANGVTIRDYWNVKSPDYDGAGGNGAVGIADLVAFAHEFNGGSAGCHDYTNDGATSLGDLVIFGEAFSAANHCP